MIDHRRLLQGEDSEYTSFAMGNQPRLAYIETALTALQDAVDRQPIGSECRRELEYALRNTEHAMRMYRLGR